MSEQDLDRRKYGSFERHFQTILVIIVAGLMGWVGTSTNQNNQEMVRTQEQIKFLSATVAELKDLIKDGYTAKEAKREHELLWQAVNGNSGRIETLERRQ